MPNLGSVIARQVPTLGLEQQVVSKKPIARNDEVASILKGLKLDREFFLSRVNDNQTDDLMGTDGGTQDLNEVSPAKRRVSRMKSKVNLKAAKAKVKNNKSADFDIYLGEALMPVLAQALDSLCRQVNLMNMQGDSLDPKVRARFNPLTWLAQQLLRRHPRGAKTPRRQAIYGNFRDWADLERGRREMLRRRDIVQDVFEGFVLRGVVQRDDLPSVVDAIDDTLRLDGVLKNSKALRYELQLDADEALSPTKRRDREDFFKDGGWTFEQFWKRFASVIKEGDVVPFSVIQGGIEQMQQAALLGSEAEAARKKQEEDKKQQEADQRRQSEEYVILHREMQEDEHIKAVRFSDKVLTGDDVRPGDAGYEFEVPPNGAHVALLVRLLVLLGFDSLVKTRSKPASAGPGGAPLPATLHPQLLGADDPERSASKVGERWWDDDLAKAWMTLQELHGAEICDGVVEREVLDKVLVPPVGYLLLKTQVAEFMENTEENEAMVSEGSRRVSGADAAQILAMGKKPSIATLCARLGVSMSRMEWLHRLFESFLQPDENDPTAVPVCLYPDCPAAIKKVQMRSLMKELRPSMEEVEFEMRFRRIDVDMSNMVEFDEFVTWVREDEVRVAGAEPLNKMSFEELAVVYDESVELIKYLHAQFQDQFPPDERDNYPKDAKSLSKDAVRALVSSLTPDMSDADFETQFQMTTFSKKDTLEFDEFLEIIPMYDLPDEIREPGGGNSPSHGGYPAALPGDNS